jgi:hypothetical protein
MMATTAIGNEEYWRVIAEEYADFKEFLVDELGVDYYHEVWEKFEEKQKKDERRARK